MIVHTTHFAFVGFLPECCMDRHSTAILSLIEELAVGLEVPSEAPLASPTASTTVTLTDKRVDEFHATSLPNVRRLRTDKGMEVETSLTDEEATLIVGSHFGEDEFADRLYSDYRKFKGLTHSKLPWLHRKALDFLAKEFGIEETVPMAKGGYSRLFDLFNRAGNLQFPTITFYSEDRDIFQLVHKRAGAYPEAINLSSGPKTQGGRFYGRVSRDGVLHPTKYEIPQFALAILAELMDDPEKTMAKYGKRTGCCCMCDTLLTDEISLAFGYGPTCAKNYSLPHGATEARRRGILK